MTSEVRRILRRENVPFGDKKNPTTRQALVDALWAYASGLIMANGRRVAVIVFDNVDLLARMETTSNLLKAGFGESRRVVFESAEIMRNERYRISVGERDRMKYNPRIAQPEFDVPMRLVWLSEANFTDPAVFGKTTEHFRALVAMGLDPICIDDDAAHDGFAVFCCVHWLATEGNALRSLGFTWDQARLAVQFYVQNIHRLIDIFPRRLIQIAQAIRECPDPVQRDEKLGRMLRSVDQRPRLKLPQPWVTSLLWPSECKFPPQSAEPSPAASKPLPDRQAEPEPGSEPPANSTEPEPVKPDPEAVARPLEGTRVSPRKPRATARASRKKPWRLIPPVILDE